MYLACFVVCCESPVAQLGPARKQYARRRRQFQRPPGNWRPATGDTRAATQLTSDLRKSTRRFRGPRLQPHRRGEQIFASVRHFSIDTKTRRQRGPRRSISGRPAYVKRAPFGLNFAAQPATITTASRGTMRLMRRHYLPPFEFRPTRPCLASAAHRPRRGRTGRRAQRQIGNIDWAWLLAARPQFMPLACVAWRSGRANGRKILIIWRHSVGGQLAKATMRTIGQVSGAGARKALSSLGAPIELRLARPFRSSSSPVAAIELPTCHCGACIMHCRLLTRHSSTRFGPFGSPPVSERTQ